MTVVAPAQAIAQSTNGHIQGDVDLAPGVAIAPGVLLGAAPGCRLIISAGVVLGADAVVQARQGDLVIAPGVSLGSGVLVVGHGTIGQHTCIGSNSTVINPQLGAAQVIAPGSLVGVPSPAPAADSDLWSDGDGQGSNGQSSNGQSSNGQSSNGQNGQTQNGNHQGNPNQNGAQVYGKAQVSRLLSTLFPHRQALNGTAPENRP